MADDSAARSSITERDALMQFGRYLLVARQDPIPSVEIKKRIIRTVVGETVVRAAADHRLGIQSDRSADLVSRL
jgi:hypothetical protein